MFFFGFGKINIIINRLDKLITPKEILLGKDDKVVRDALMNAICDGNGAANYRADIASILTMMVNRWPAISYPILQLIVLRLNER